MGGGVGWACSQLLDFQWLEKKVVALLLEIEATCPLSGLVIKCHLIDCNKF